MKIAIGSDERTHMTDAVMDELRRRGYELLPLGLLDLTGGAAEAPSGAGDAIAPPVRSDHLDTVNPTAGAAEAPSGAGDAIAPPVRSDHLDTVSPTGGAAEAPSGAGDAIAPPVRSDHLWPAVAGAVAEAVAGGAADEGILFCWTGTGVSMAANKVPGVRAALCDDAETARGARLWNNANVLCLSLRRTSEVIAKEIMDAWFNTSFIPNDTDDACLAQLSDLEHRHRGS